tara:strand:- start:704 stop:1057 length:354 start_codon:yes stop_codon:yes gene_type:complete
VDREDSSENVEMETVSKSHQTSEKGSEPEMVIIEDDSLAAEVEECLTDLSVRTILLGKLVMGELRKAKVMARVTIATMAKENELTTEGKTISRVLNKLEQRGLLVQCVVAVPKMAGI